MRNEKLEMDVGAMIGEPVVAVVVVSPHKAASAAMKKGLISVVIDQILGQLGDNARINILRAAVGGVIDEATAPLYSEEEKVASKKPLWGPILAVTQNKFAILESQVGLLGTTVKNLVIQVPKEAVAHFEFGKGSLISTVGIVIVLKDGRVFFFEIGKLAKGYAEKIKAALNL